jgi:hypothetical protein
VCRVSYKGDEPRLGKDDGKGSGGGGTLFRRKTTAGSKKDDKAASAAAAQVATAAAVAAQVQTTQLDMDELVGLTERQQLDLLQRLIDNEPDNRTCFDCMSTAIAAASGACSPRRRRHMTASTAPSLRPPLSHTQCVPHMHARMHSTDCVGGGCQ